MSDETPLRALLRAPFSDAQVDRMWAEISSRRAAAKRARRWSLAVPVAAAAAVALALVARRPPPPQDAGALRLRDGAALTARALRDEGASPRVVALSDASQVELSPGTALALRENDGRAFVVAMDGGRARFSVTPGGPRRWRVDCGLATVTVVGTAFTVERAPHALTVSVAHGRVWVDGARVPNGHRVLDAGDAITLTDAPTPPRAAPAGPPPPVAPEPARVVTRPVAREPSPDALLQRADDARRARRYDLAAPLLERFVALHPEHPEAAMAAFTLGRDALTQRQRPGDAARWFERALALHPPRSIEEDLRARLVEARHAAGDPAGACAAARAYAAAFPRGRYAATVRSRCEGE